MTESPCAFCGRPASQLHHLTGRSEPRGPYFDRDLVVPLCVTCHVREHVVLRRLGLEFPTADALSHRLRRVADHLGRLVDSGCRFALDVDATRGLCALVLEAADATDREVVRP